MSKNNSFREVAREPAVVGDSNSVAPIDMKRFDDDLLSQPAAQTQLRIENKALAENTSKILPTTEFGAVEKAKERHIGQQGPVTTVLDGFGSLVSKSVDHQDGRSLIVNYEKGIAVKLTRPDGYAFVKNDTGTWNFTNPNGDVLWNARKFSVKLHDDGSVTYKVNSTSEKLIDPNGKYHDLGKMSFKPENNNKIADSKVTTKDDMSIPALGYIHPAVKQNEIYKDPQASASGKILPKAELVDKKEPANKDKSSSKDDSSEHPKLSWLTRVKNKLSEISQTLKVSCYGGKFHGRLTASGEKYDKNDLTAAHKSLPFGTKLLVHNNKNGKDVEVYVNDRGPYVPGDPSRVVDLSVAAKQAITPEVSRDQIAAQVTKELKEKHIHLSAKEKEIKIQNRYEKALGVSAVTIQVVSMPAGNRKKG